LTAGGLEGKSCLEVGCGHTGFSSWFGERGARLLEGDLVFEAVSELKQRQDGDVNVLCLDANFLPFKNGTFDVIFCVGVIHHFSQIGTPLNEMARCVKPGGSIYIVEPNKQYLPTVVIEAMPRRWPRFIRQRLVPKLFPGYVPPADYEHPLSTREIREALSNQAVSKLEIDFEYNIGVPPYLARWLLGYDSIVKVITRVFPPLSKWLAWQLIAVGRKE
jgi:SAM-dependent methyltransferase